MSKPLIEIDPQKLLRVVARTSAPGVRKPMHQRRTVSLGPDADDMSMIERLQVIAQQVESFEAGAVCGLSPEGIERCTSAVEEACPVREMAPCPRRREAAWREQARRLRAESSKRGVPERVLRAAFDEEPRDTPALQAVLNFLSRSRSILVLSGTNQCGKTTAAGWAACCHLSLGGESRRTRFVTAAEATRPDVGEALALQAKSLQLLVIDDIGQAFFGQSGYSLRQLEVIVDAVYQGNGRLILTTDIALRNDANKLPFFELMGRRITSRISQAGQCVANLGGVFGQPPAHGAP